MVILGIVFIVTRLDQVVGEESIDPFIDQGISSLYDRLENISIQITSDKKTAQGIVSSA